MPCRHPDVRKFDGVRCCLACGEAVFDTAQQTPATQASSAEVQVQYSYANLNSKLGQEIRIIVLQPGRGTEPIRCEVVHVNLEDRPRFEAVSYTWATEDGDDIRCATVYLSNNTALPVTANCEAVLRQLRLLSQERRLWVDALCINQINLNERNHQVGLMDRIFSGAERVIISIPYLANDTKVNTFPEDQLSVLFSWLQGTVRMVRTPESHPDNRIVSILAHLLQARYFQRVWTIQEVALARNVVLCVNESAIELSFPILDRIRSAKAVPNIPAALRWNPGLASETDVLSCLRAGIDSHCSDARDKVFAVLSLMEPRARSYIPVDYSLDLETIYANTLLALIATDCTLEVLVFALLQHPRPTSGDQEHGAIIAHGMFEMYIMSGRRYWTCNDTISDPWKDKPTSTWRPKITVQTTPALDECIDDRANLDRSATVFEVTCNTVSGCLLPRFQTRAHFIDTITWHQDPERAKYSRPRSYIGELKFDRCTRFLPFFSRYPHPQSPFFELHMDMNPTDTITENNAPGINVPDLREFMSSFKNTGGDRLLFTTHYSIGHARGGIRIGDAVFVLDGARVPFILRKNDQGEYHVVTVCYVWAALELDYWNPGTQKGLWGSRHFEHACEQTQMITVH